MNDRLAVTQLLAQSQAGDTAALQALYGRLYPEIKRLARSRLREQAQVAGLDTTGLAHEGFLRIADAEGLRGATRAQFFAYVGQVLRSVVIDELRANRRDKRGGADAVWVTLSAADSVSDSAGGPLDLLAVNQALDQLRRFDAPLAELVDLVGFAGLDAAEVAELRGVSLRTVQRELQKARALLSEML
jgi:RNA polymerase sigma factor (TIGR02999 family)